MADITLKGAGYEIEAQGRKQALRRLAGQKIHLIPGGVAVPAGSRIRFAGYSASRTEFEFSSVGAPAAKPRKQAKAT